MAFTSKCAIKKSNPKLWRKLVEMGHKHTPFYPAMKESSDDNPLYTVVENGIFYNEKTIDPEYIHDCGDNEDMFFALAALRDDSDIFQWFIYDDRDHEEENPSRFWFKCTTHNVKDDMINGKWEDCIKAVSQEIVYHFTHPDDDDTID